MFYFGSYLGLLLLALIVGSLIRQIYITVTPPRRASKQPACEKCGYHIAGLTSYTCPECSTDLRLTGIITLPMEMRRRGGLISAVLCWSVIMLAAGIMGTGLAFSAFATNAFIPRSTTTTCALIPSSGAYASIETRITDSGTYVTTNLNLILPDQSSHLLIIRQSFGAGLDVILDGNVTTLSAPATPVDLAPWFSSAGLDTSVQAHQLELADLASLAAVANTSSLTAFSPTSFTMTPPVTTASASSVSFWYDVAPVLAAATALLALYIFGLYFIISRRRRLTRASHAIDRALVTPATATPPDRTVPEHT